MPVASAPPPAVTITDVPRIYCPGPRRQGESHLVEMQALEGSLALPPFSYTERGWGLSLPYLLSCSWLLLAIPEDYFSGPDRIRV